MIELSNSDSPVLGAFLKNIVFQSTFQSDNLPIKRDVILRGSRESLNGYRFESNRETLLTWLFLFRALHRVRSLLRRSR